MTTIAIIGAGWRAEFHQKGLIDDKEFKELKAKLIQD